MTEKREAHTFSEISLDRLKDGTVLETLDGVLKDQIPLRNTIIKLYQKAKKTSMMVFSDSLLDTLSEGVIAIDDGYLIANPYQEKYQDTFTSYMKADNINQLLKRYPDISMYLYMPTRIEETDLFSFFENPIIESHNVFFDCLSEEITCDSLSLTSVEDYKKYYYRTDHHWNAEGAYQGYSDIIQMIGKDFEIGELLPYSEPYSIDAPFLGHFAAESSEESVCDQVTDMYVGLEDDMYDYYVNGEKTRVIDGKYNYIDKSDKFLYEGFDMYFMFNDFERIFDFHQEDRPNILIFADSFVNPIRDWLASHFNRTVILDMRSKPEDFDIDRYMKEYDIDCVLFLQYYFNLYYNGDLLIPLD